MKTNSILSLCLLIALIAFSSCMKDEGNVKTIVINVELNANDSYSYTIPPVGDDDDVMAFSKQAQHYSKSAITPLNSKQTSFEYTPAQDYSGSDEVIIHNTEGGKHSSHHGKCGGHHGHDETNYDFKITILGDHL